MDYEKAYKNALAHAREIHRNEGEKRRDMEWLFPELKESEDERIRKGLINYFNHHKNGINIFYGIKGDDILDWLERQSESSDQIRYWTEEEIEPIISDYLRGAEHYGGMIARLRCLKPKSLEKQAQKSTIEMKSAEESLGIDSDTYNEIVDECIYGEQKSQRMISAEAKEAMYDKPADKVEPKFNIDDWVVYYRNDSSREVLQVYDIRDGRYYFTDNVHFSWSVKECDEKSHLWTIQDAKFKCLNDNLFSSHCFMDHEGWFCEDGGQAHTLDNRICGEIYPATNEQCDTLMKAMADAGYTFDFDKRELKKIEQKSAEWSEEDEKKFADACIMLDWYKGNNWWTAQYIKDWLKSLKDRYTWKPSDEQMEALKHYVDTTMDGDIDLLYQDLKELKGG